MPSDKRLPRSRAARGAAVARLAGEQVARNAATKTANLTRGSDSRRIAVERRHVEAAEQMINVLGTMKGAAMKFGQMLSVLDLGFLPDEDRPRIQAKLAALTDSAPSYPFATMRRQLEREIGPVGKHFADIDEAPVGAASIGQVFRAELKDGRDVAVKVQYPGIAPAVKADLKNLNLLVRLGGNVAPGIDFGALVDELRERMQEELDYRLEAANQQAAGTHFGGHPFIVVPGVVASLSTERVLVTDFVPGRRSDAVEADTAAVRDRVGEILYRFYCGSLYRLGQFSGDPHPGNYLALDDGRVAFLDFGHYKRMDAGALHLQRSVLRATFDDDGATAYALLVDAGVIQQPELVDTASLMAYFRDVYGWYIEDVGPRTLTLAMATASLLTAADPRSAYFAQLREQALPAEHLVARRTEAYTLGLLGRLRATADWHAIAREWLFGEAPQTELGRVEADYFAGV